MLNLILSFHIKNFSVHSINHSDKSSLQPQSKHAHYVKSSLYPLIALSFSPAQAHALSQHARALSLSLALSYPEGKTKCAGKPGKSRFSASLFGSVLPRNRSNAHPFGIPSFLKRREKKRSLSSFKGISVKDF